MKSLSDKNHETHCACECVFHHARDLSAPPALHIAEILLLGLFSITGNSRLMNAQAYEIKSNAFF